MNLWTLTDERARARFDTPGAIADFLAARVLPAGPHAAGCEPTVWDPTCGGGALLMAAQRLGARVFGSDRDPVAAAEAASNLGETVGGRIRVVDILADAAAFLEGAAAGPWAEVVAAGGFGAVLTNPPWDKLKLHAHEALGSHAVAERRSSRRQAEADPRIQAAMEERRRHTELRAAKVGARAGIRVGDRNAYQGVLALAMDLVRQGGALGAVLPGGFWSDLGSRPLRERLLTEFQQVTTWGFEARTDAFPDIDQRIVLVVATGKRPERIQSGRRERGNSLPKVAEVPPDSEHALSIVAGIKSLDDLPKARPFEVPLSLVRRTAPLSAAFPPLTDPADVAILEALYQAGPAFGDGPWQPAFGREIDMTTDAELFEGVQPPRSELNGGRQPYPGGRQLERGEGVTGLEGVAIVPLWEGKRIGAFELCPVDPLASGAWPTCAAACSRAAHCPATRSGGEQLWIDLTRLKRPDRGHALHSRVAWRSVARADRARRLEAALVPAGYRLGNSLNYLKGDRHDLPAKLTLLAYLNSLVVEWRLRQLAQGNNINLFTIRQLPIPPGIRRSLWEPAGRLMLDAPGLEAERQAFDALVPGGRAARSRTTQHRTAPSRVDLRRQLEASVARSFGLDKSQFERILDAFPKLPRDEHTCLLEAWELPGAQDT